MTSSAWRATLAKLGARKPLAAPAALTALAEAERALGLALPAELRSLLSECDGVRDRYATPVVWPAGEIAERNREFRTKPEFRSLYMPFDAMLFFGDAGNGDQFFYRVLDGEVRDPDVYVWDHETDGRIWRAARLEPFLVSVLAETT